MDDYLIVENIDPIDPDCIPERMKPRELLEPTKPE